jgi:putative flippase GtrA
VTVVESLLAHVPAPLRSVLVKHRELVKFGMVGSIAFGVDNVVWYALKLTVLMEKPTTAKAIGILVATIVSYILNREWSFRWRGGRETHHEAALFFFISGVAIVINLIPLYVSRYVLNLEVPHVSLFAQEVADFTSGSIIGMLLAMAFRFWGYRRWVFPDEFEHVAAEVAEDQPTR